MRNAFAQALLASMAMSETTFTSGGLPAFVAPARSRKYFPPYLQGEREIERRQRQYARGIKKAANGVVEDPSARLREQVLLVDRLSEQFQRARVESTP